VTVMKLLEMQRHAMLMYTSCGWFFDELSGIETVQVIQYAARVLQLAHETFNQDFESPFLDLLAKAKCNISQHKDGREIYEKFVKPARIDWPHAVAHYAISSVFQEYPQKVRIFSYTYVDEKRERLVAGKARLALGQARVVSEITQESRLLAYAALYMGEHNLDCGVCNLSPEAYETMTREIKDAFSNADFPQVIRLVNTHFGQPHYSLKSLFKDEQRRILDDILASTREDLEQRFRLITERYTPLMKFLETAGMPLPMALKTASDFILHSDIRRQFETERADLDRLKALLQEAQSRDGAVLNVRISYAIKQRLEQLMRQLAEDPCNIEQTRYVDQLVELVMPLKAGLNLGEVENIFWDLRQTVLPALHRRAADGEEKAKDCAAMFEVLGGRLGFTRSN
jgi:hypothetical protein